MPLLSVSKAAKQFDVSRPTLQKALKDGTITGQKIMVGGSESWQIDTAELARLYPMRDGMAGNLPSQDEPNGQRLATDNSGDIGHLADEAVKKLESELQAAKAELAVSRALADERLRIMDKMAEDHRDVLSDMMKALPKPDQAQRRGLWQRLFGGR